MEQYNISNILLFDFVKSMTFTYMKTLDCWAFWLYQKVGLDVSKYVLNLVYFQVILEQTPFSANLGV